MRRTLRTSLRYGLAVVFVALATAVADGFYRLTGSDRLSAIFIAGVLLTAFVAGAGAAYLASFLAFFSYLFLVDPRYRFSFGSPDDFNVLALFLVTAILAGTLTGRARDAATRAERRSMGASALLAATADFSAAADVAFIRKRLVQHVATAARGVALLRTGTDVVASCTQPDEAGVVGSLEIERKASPNVRQTRTVGRWSYRPLIADTAVWGVLAWSSHDAAQLEDDEVTLVEVLADTGAAALARADLATAKAEVEAKARTEDLRNALLSSISHDLRTPLSAILASATSLQAYGETFDADTRRDLAATIHEEVLRMDDSVANLLAMSRLAAGEVQIRTVPFNVPEIIGRSTERRGRAASDRIQLQVAPELADARGDPVLFEQAFGNVLENAIRHGGAEGAIEVEALRVADMIEVRVADRGPGVPPAELEAIFERFYRAAGAARTPGTGLGLSIARGLINAMEGDIRAARREGGGLIVGLRVPAA